MTMVQSTLRVLAAIAVTVLAALALYFVFLHGKDPTDPRVQSAAAGHLVSSDPHG
ncbi:hypothetical protein [Mycolicibacterium sediminis]|uniref:Uncharacterized protein n=1 Tax=Mycolicibacterium sediminis TaxID=1286180 RepID=A0A7I7QS27_9MYCO|nr:hypothetical protein [Mycolicibacterium sediminis]BBY28626.1 hypothetical protein MSEDJ_27220 [Mycolicibacterium sediminis]